MSKYKILALLNPVPNKNLGVIDWLIYFKGM